jgi:hypothetical protein
MTITTSPDLVLRRPATRTIGFWLAVPMAALQAFNVVRVLLDPAGFATYMGAPLVAAGDASWVLIYGLRTAFIALLVTILLVRRDLDALKWTALAALLIPLGDAWVAQQAGAATATVARHAGIAAYLLITTIALFAAARARPS